MFHFKSTAHCVCALKISGWEKNNWKLQWPMLSVSQQHMLSGQIPGDRAASTPSDFSLFQALLPNVPWKTLIHLLYVGGKCIFFSYCQELKCIMVRSITSGIRKLTVKLQAPHLVVVLGWLGEVAQLVSCTQAPRWIGEWEPKSRLPCIYPTVQASFAADPSG